MQGPHSLKGCGWDKRTLAICQLAFNRYVGVPTQDLQ